MISPLVSKRRAAAVLLVFATLCACRLPEKKLESVQDSKAARPKSPDRAQTYWMEDELARKVLAKATRDPSGKTTANAPEMWVRMENTEPIPGSLYAPGETCHIAREEEVELVRIERTYLILRYTPSKKPRGSMCPDGTLFQLFIPPDVGSRSSR